MADKEKELELEIKNLRKKRLLNKEEHEKILELLKGNDSEKVKKNMKTLLDEGDEIINKLKGLIED